MTRSLYTVLVAAIVAAEVAHAGESGEVLGWGSNFFGETNIPPGLTNCVAVAAGGWHAIVLSSLGNVTAWGRGSEGQTNVPVDLGNVVAIAAGNTFSLALTPQGTVRAWGRCWDTSVPGYVPMYVPTGLSNVVAIAGGGGHALALKSDSTVTALGFNATGETNVTVWPE